MGRFLRWASGCRSSRRSCSGLLAWLLPGFSVAGLGAAVVSARSRSPWHSAVAWPFIYRFAARFHPLLFPRPHLSPHRSGRLPRRPSSASAICRLASMFWTGSGQPRSHGRQCLCRRAFFARRRLRLRVVRRSAVEEAVLVDADIIGRRASSSWRSMGSPSRSCAGPSTTGYMPTLKRWIAREATSFVPGSPIFPPRPRPARPASSSATTPGSPPSAGTTSHSAN